MFVFHSFFFIIIIFIYNHIAARQEHNSSTAGHYYLSGQLYSCAGQCETIVHTEIYYVVYFYCNYF
jgi:hypothetical protein